MQKFECELQSGLNLKQQILPNFKEKDSLKNALVQIQQQSQELQFALSNKQNNLHLHSANLQILQTEYDNIMIELQWKGDQLTHESRLKLEQIEALQLKAEPFESSLRDLNEATQRTDEEFAC